MENTSDLYRLKREDFLSLEGFKDAKSDNLYGALQRSKSVNLATFIYALGIENVGKKTAVDLSNHFKSLQAFISANTETLVSIGDIGEITAESIVGYFSDENNLSEINALLSLGVTVDYINEKKGDVFSGEKFVLTGTLENFKRDEAAKIIESLGGEVLSSVSKNVTVVLAGENAGSKLDKARALNIKIMDEETFKSLVKS